MKRRLFTILPALSLLLKRKVPQFVIELAIALCIIFAFGAWVSKGIGRGGMDLRFAVASVALAVAAVAALVRNQRLSKPRFGHFCSTCGYELRATPDRPRVRDDERNICRATEAESAHAASCCCFMSLPSLALREMRVKMRVIF